LTNQSLLNLFLDVNLPFGIEYRLNTSASNYSREEGRYYSNKSRLGNEVNGKGGMENRRKSEYLLENIIKYNKTIGQHKINFTGVHGISYRDIFTNGFSAENFPIQELRYNGIEQALTQKGVERSGSQRKLLSFLGRINYNYKEKYLLAVSMRADASSVFSTSNKWGYFPSVALGWRLSEEQFLQSVDAISSLKIRTSYGITGNEAIPPYTTLGVMTDYKYIFGNDPATGYLQSSMLPNDQLKWESTSTWNMGVDFAFFDHRISGSFDMYNKTTTDLLVKRDLPKGTGYTEMYDNIGEINNHGIETAITFIPVRGKDFKFSITPMFTANRNKIVHLFGDRDGDGIEDDLISEDWYIGYPIDVSKHYLPDGVWQFDSDKELMQLYGAIPGHPRVQDLANDIDPDTGLPIVKIDEQDQVITSKYPDWYGDLVFDFKYKNLSVFVDFYAVQNITKLNKYLYSYNSGGNLRSFYNGIDRDYWMPDNPTNEWPIVGSTSSSPYLSSYLESFAYQDASYVRLKTIKVMLDLPSKMLSKLSISNASIYLTGTNLWTTTEFQSYSPEISAAGYPEAAKYVFGFNVIF